MHPSGLLFDCRGLLRGQPLQPCAHVAQTARCERYSGLFAVLEDSQGSGPEGQCRK